MRAPRVTGAAARRRERRLRSMLRHERQTAALRRVGTGTEAGELSGCAASCSERARAAAGVGAPSLADAAGDAVDGSALRFLTASTLAARRREEEAEEQRKVEEEKKAKKALTAWNARRKAVTDEMYAPLDVGRLTPAQRARETELIRELDVIDAAMPPALPKRRQRKKRRRRWTTRSQLNCSSRFFFFLCCGSRVLTPRLLVIIRVFAWPACGMQICRPLWQLWW